MAPIILSARLRGDLEDLVLRTPSAKQRCRTRRCSGSPRALSAEQVAENVPGQPSDRLQLGQPLPPARRPRAQGTSARRPTAGPPPFDRRGHRPLDRGSLRWRSPRVGLSCHGLGPPSCCSTTWSTLMGSRPPSRASARRSHAWVSAGNGPGMSWRPGRGPGAKQKGAETRPEGSHAHRNLDAGRDDRHGDTSAV